MATNNREKLFAEFPPVSTEAWEAAITADLKGADYERKLVWRTNEGFNLRPYYRAENLEGLETLGAQAGEFPYLRGVSTDNTWLTHQTIKVACPKEANATALAMLESGVDSLGFCFCEAEVEPTAESISKWFKAGAFAVGMGSCLFPKELMASKDWSAISKICAEAIAVVEQER